MQGKILLIEDTLEFQKIVESTLGIRYKVDCADTLALGRAKLADNTYDLILLDVVLPDGTGFDLCREIQSAPETANIPIIFLTVKDSISDKFTGFSLGADDYVTKPFDTAELLLRVDSKILKSQKIKYFSENIQRGPLRLEVSSMSVYLHMEGSEKRVDVTPIEFKLLLKLAQNNQRVLSRQQLIDSVWGHGVYIEDRSIDKHVSSIRRKIDPFGELIRTVTGVGYEFQM